MKRTTIATFAVILSLASGGGFASALEAPAAVSPGKIDELAVSASRCPVFSWGAVADASAFELVVFALPEAEFGGIEAGLAQPALRKSIPGTALSWSPSLAECLDLGTSYGWSVRAIENDQPGAWSEARLFKVSTAPSVRDVEQALEVLKRFQASRGAPALPQATAQEPASAALAEKAERTRRSSTLPGKAAAGVAAIRGEQGDASGETYGVHGIAASTTNGTCGLVGEATAISGSTCGVTGRVESAVGTAAFFENTAGGKLLSGVSSGTEVFSVEGDGTIKIVDGNQAAGKILTSDAAGLAGWQAPVPWDPVPSGAVMFFNLATCPSGWSALTAAEGRYLVGLPSSGTLAATAGTALSDQENRAVGLHNHTEADPGHRHQYWGTASSAHVEPPGSNPASVATPTSVHWSFYSKVTINNAGTVAGTTAPYLQLLVCEKD